MTTANYRSLMIGGSVEISSKVADAILRNPAGSAVAIGHALAHVFLHVALMLSVAWMYQSARTGFFPSEGRSRIFVAYLGGITLFLMMANMRLFPESIAIPRGDILWRQSLAWPTFLLLGATGLVIGILALANAWRTRRRTMPALFAGIALAIGVAATAAEVRAPTTAQARTRPDVILLGIDSLRPDHLPAHGYPHQGLTPHIDGLMHELVRFDNAATPQSRTFVSYMSLLTGQYPIRHGARFNLHPRERFPHDNTLAHRLRQDGYVTAYATDETRFANIDHRFGFDSIAAPPANIFDFLIGSTYDSIATNLLLATPAGKGLFPHTHANRAAYRLYRPEDHIQRTNALVAQLPDERSVFLISHLCLPHWPYLPSNFLDAHPAAFAAQENAQSVIHADYLRSVHAADKQIGSIVDALRAGNRLHNAILILFSDHGEGLGLAPDALHPLPGHRVPGAPSAIGHGNFALTDADRRVVLGMQRYVDGQPQWRPRNASDPVSLIDIAPTILDLLGHAPPARMQGVSLASVMGEETTLPAGRIRFVESGLLSATLLTQEIDELAVADAFSHLYRVADDFRAEIDPAQLPEKLALKQRGAIFGQYGLSTLPARQDMGTTEDCWLFVDYSERTMHCLSPSSTPTPVAGNLQREICGHFAADDGFVERWCSHASLQASPLPPTASRG